MIKFWPRRASRIPSYRRLSAETPSETAKFLKSYVDPKSSAETEIGNTQAPEPGKLVSHNSRCIRIALCLLVFICFCETSALILQHVHRPSNPYTSNKTPVPPNSVPNQLRPFTDFPSLHGLQTAEEVEEGWRALDLPVNGFVYLPNPEEYGFLPNKHVTPGAENVYSVSAYHQLHCLKSMHLAFIDLSNKRPGDEKMNLAHLEHCIAYITQGVMCAGDITLEGPDVEGKGSFQGWGIVHECRVWEGKDGLVEKILVWNDKMLKHGS